MWKVLESKIKIAGLMAVLMTSILAAGCATTSGNHWQRKLASELPVMGHRNWILIADSAYPAQSRAGIETIATGAGQIDVVKVVLKAVDDAKHPNLTASRMQRQPATTMTAMTTKTALLF